MRRPTVYGHHDNGHLLRLLKRRRRHRESGARCDSWRKRRQQHNLQHRDINVRTGGVDGNTDIRGTAFGSRRAGKRTQGGG